jgi:hypothetical protein
MWCGLLLVAGGLVWCYIPSEYFCRIVLRSVNLGLPRFLFPSVSETINYVSLETNHSTTGKWYHLVAQMFQSAHLCLGPECSVFAYKPKSLVRQYHTNRARLELLANLSVKTMVLKSLSVLDVIVSRMSDNVLTLTRASLDLLHTRWLRPKKKL